jgi:hypothetical protein
MIACHIRKGIRTGVIDDADGRPVYRYRNKMISRTRRIGNGLRRTVRNEGSIGVMLPPVTDVSIKNVLI